RHGVRVVAESLQGGEDEDLELAEEIAFGHGDIIYKSENLRNHHGPTGTARVIERSSRRSTRGDRRSRNTTASASGPRRVPWSRAMSPPEAALPYVGARRSRRTSDRASACPAR